MIPIKVNEKMHTHMYLKSFILKESGSPDDLALLLSLYIASSTTADRTGSFTGSMAPLFWKQSCYLRKNYKLKGFVFSFLNKKPK